MSAAACADAPANAPEGDEVGDLSVELLGTDSAGQQYRLRNAEFQITGYLDFGSGGSGGSAGSGSGSGTTIVVSSEVDPDAPVLTATVVPGSYYVTLYSGWYIERLTAGGPEVVEQTVLLSDPTQWTYVWQDGESNVNYRFGVDGELIDFRHGDINIGIEIERPGEGPGGPGGSGGFGGTAGGGGAGGASAGFGGAGGSGQGGASGP